MPKSDIQIEIVRSATKGFSSMSQVSAEAVLAVLAKHYVAPRITVINNLSDLKALVRRRPDLVFMGMECIPLNSALGSNDSNRVWIAQYLDEHDIAYTGSTQTAHKLERDKSLAKQRVLDGGLATSPFYVIKQGQVPSADDLSLPFPLFIKPTDRGGGEGVDGNSVVYTLEQLHAKTDALTNVLQADSLVEEYLPGHEFSVAILKKEHSLGYEIMPIELIAPPDNGGIRILSREVKSSNTEQANSVDDTATNLKVAELALQVFHALGGRDYGRIDIRLDAAGAPHFLEANLIPSLISGYGSFPKACVLNIGLEYEPMIMRITNLGLARMVNGSEDALEPVSRHDPTFQLAEAASALA
jgi:D-alanine-D-alanine ligase